MGSPRNGERSLLSSAGSERLLPKLLVMSINSATNLSPDKDSYVEIHQGGTVKKTQIKKGESPEWNETFSFVLNDPDSNALIMLK